MPTTDRPQPRNAGLAAFLSFLFPGLGQAYAGRRRIAVLFAAPVLLVLISILAIRLLSADRLRNELFSATFLTIALAVNLALMIWRLVAIAQAGAAARPRSSAVGRGSGRSRSRSSWRCWPPPSACTPGLGRSSVA